MNFLAALLLALSLNIPFTSIEAAKNASNGFGLMSCPADFVPVLFIPGKSDAQEFRLAFTDQRFVFLEVNDSGAGQVWFGSVENKDTLKVREVFDLAGARAKYPSPCDFLFPNGA